MEHPLDPTGLRRVHHRDAKNHLLHAERVTLRGGGIIAYVNLLCIAGFLAVRRLELCRCHQQKVGFMQFVIAIL